LVETDCSANRHVGRARMTAEIMVFATRLLQVLVAVGEV
jgi:hypothetical protein